MFTLTLKDETASGGITNNTTLEFEREEITVKDIIEKRVHDEVSAYNKEKQDIFHGLVRPKNAVQVIQGFKMGKEKSIDPEKQFYVACDGFLKNAFFMIASGKQLETLEQTIKLSEVDSVSFIKLTPLVGG